MYVSVSIYWKNIHKVGIFYYKFGKTHMHHRVPGYLFHSVLFFCRKGIFIHLGCCNKIPQMRELINNKYLFLTVLEAGSLRIGGQVRALFQFQNSRCALTWRNG